LQAKQNILRRRVFFAQIVRVVSSDERHAEARGKIQLIFIQFRWPGKLGWSCNSRKNFLAEKFVVFQNPRLGFIHLPGFDQVRNFAAQAGGYRQSDRRDIFQQLPVNARLIIKSFQMRGRN